VPRLGCGGIADEHGIARSRSVVHEALSVRGPVRFRHALEIGPWGPAQHGHRPDADVRACRIDDAPPVGHEAAVGCEPQGAERWVGDFRLRSEREVVELPGPDLGDPDIQLALAIRDKGDEPAVARERRRLFVAREVGK
jgi:hypothetical protein